MAMGDLNANMNNERIPGKLLEDQGLGEQYYDFFILS